MSGNQVWYFYEPAERGRLCVIRFMAPHYTGGGEVVARNVELELAKTMCEALNSYASSKAEIERLRAENATLRAVATKIDADWTEAFPEGPEGDRTYLGGFGTLSDDTVEVWRVIRAALSGSKE